MGHTFVPVTSSVKISKNPWYIQKISFINNCQKKKTEGGQINLRWISVSKF